MANQQVEQSDQIISWEQPKSYWGRFELCREGVSIGSMRWTHLCAVAEMPAATWTYRRKGTTNRHIPLLRGDDEVEDGIFFYTSATEGTVKLNDGRSFHWVRPNKLKNVWELHNENNHVMFNCLLKTSPRGSGADLTVHNTDIDRETFQLLVTLAWYLIYTYALDTGLATEARVLR